MIEVTIQRNSVNIEALDAQLRNALGDATTGLSFASGQVIVHLTEKATPADLENVRAIVTTHDSSVLTPSQVEALAQRQKLDEARRDYGAAAIDLSTYVGKDPLLTILAQKIAWLEREIAALHPTP